jgi:hypothetical protein
MDELMLNVESKAKQRFLAFSGSKCGSTRCSW